MTMLEQRLQSAARELNEHVKTSFVHKPFHSPVSHQRLRRLGLAAATAAVFATCILVLAIMAPFGGSGSDEADQPVASTIPAPAPLPNPGPVEVAIPSGLDWLRIEAPDLGGEGIKSIQSIQAISTGLIAVGQDANKPAIWISTDGNDWTSLDDRGRAFTASSSPYGEESRVWINDVAESDSRLVAVGLDLWNRSDVGAGSQEMSMAFWYSDDGKNWTRVPHDGGSFGLQPGWLRGSRVIATNNGFIAVGEAIWTSPDGVTWTRHEAPGFWHNDIIQTDEGLILVGMQKSDMAEKAAAWYSADGLIWTSAEIEASDRDESGFSAILETEDGFLAAGIDSHEMVWFSPDGHNWTKRGGSTDNDGYAYDRINDMAAIGDQLVAIGVRWPAVGTGATIWSSSDGGFTWDLFDDPTLILGSARSTSRNSAAESVATFDGRFVVGGWIGEDPGGGTVMPRSPDIHTEAGVWIGTPTDS